MSFWASADKLVQKEVIRGGDFSKRPTELSVCTIFIDEPQSVGLTLKEIKEDFYSEIVDQNSRKKIVIGHACSKIDTYIERALQTMCLNEQSLVTVQIPLKNAKDDVATLSIKITLEEAEFYKPIWDWTPEEKYETALKYKEKGVELFKTKRYVDAFFRFSKACKLLITLEPIEDENNATLKKVIDLKYILYNNMAECQLLKENYEHAISLCNKVLNKDENNIKALYRRGVARGGLRDFERAADDLKVVVNLEPSNKKAHEKLNFYNEQWRQSVHGYENMVRKMFKA